MARLEVFIGSSTESKIYAQYIQELIMELDPDARTYAWMNDVFLVGQHHTDSLFQIVQQTNSAIIIFSEDDQILRRGHTLSVARDTVVFEYGMFTASHGTRNVALAKLGNPAEPADVSGMTHLVLQRYPDANQFKDHNRSAIREWIKQVKQNLLNKPPTFEDVFPLLHDAVRSVSFSANPGLIEKVDHVAAAMVRAFTVSYKTNNLGGDKRYVDLIEGYYINDAVSFSAYECTGPSSWVDSWAFRYIASHMPKYLLSNIQKGKLNLQVHPWLGAAIAKAVENGRAQLNGTATVFGNSDKIKWEIRTPKLQYSRVLFWTKEELKNPITDTVIAMHEGFGVPLFFIEAHPEKKEKEIAYVVFENHKGLASGLYGKQKAAYRTDPFDKEIPGFGNALEKYQELVSRPDIMFAADARHLVLNN